MPLPPWDTGMEVSGLFRGALSSSQMLRARRPSYTGLSLSPGLQAWQGAGAASPSTHMG